MEGRDEANRIANSIAKEKIDDVGSSHGDGGSSNSSVVQLGRGLRYLPLQACQGASRPRRDCECQAATLECRGPQALVNVSVEVAKMPVA